MTLPDVPLQDSSILDPQVQAQPIGDGTISSPQPQAQYGSPLIMVPFGSPSNAGATCGSPQPPHPGSSSSSVVGAFLSPPSPFSITTGGTLVAARSSGSLPNITVTSEVGQPLPINVSTDHPIARRPSSGSSSRNSTFVHKLHDIVSDERFRALISWNHTGTSFFVFNALEFARQVLPKFFKHNNFQSFVRQLNMYGFHKLSKSSRQFASSVSGLESQVWEFSHPKFLMGRPELCDQIKRRNPDTSDREGGNGGGSRLASQSSELHGQMKVMSITQRGIVEKLSQMQKALERVYSEVRQATARTERNEDMLRVVCERMNLDGVEWEMRDTLPEPEELPPVTKHEPDLVAIPQPSAFSVDYHHTPTRTLAINTNSANNSSSASSFSNPHLLPCQAPRAAYTRRPQPLYSPTTPDTAVSGQGTASLPISPSPGQSSTSEGNFHPRAPEALADPRHPETAACKPHPPLHTQAQAQERSLDSLMNFFPTQPLVCPQHSRPTSPHSGGVPAAADAAQSLVPRVASSYPQALPPATSCTSPDMFQAAVNTPLPPSPLPPQPAQHQVVQQRTHQQLQQLARLSLGESPFGIGEFVANPQLRQQ